MVRRHGRRGFLSAAAAGIVGASGCLGGSGGSSNSVTVGPHATTRFDPKRITVSAGEHVTWSFATGGFNVSCVPDHSEHVSLPDDADPFASYGVDDPPSETMASSTRYTHEFSTPGEYVYVCVPYVQSGMVGRVVVEG